MHSVLLIDNCTIKKPVLTIAVPTFNRFHLLSETLKSVFKLKFNFSIEVIIVDNNPDGSKAAIDIMKKFERHNFKYYVNEDNYGPSGNWNRCLELANGKYVTILHDDDLLIDDFPNKLEWLFSKYSNYENIPLTGFASEVLDQRIGDKRKKINGLYLYFKKVYLKLFHTYKLDVNEVNLNKYIYRSCFTSTLGVIIEREKALLINGFDKNWYPIIDYEFYLRWIHTFGNAQFINFKVSQYRILENDSMNGDVISSVITKNFELRNYYAEKIPFSNFSKFAMLMNKIEKITWKANWEQGSEITIIDTIKLLYFKFLCEVHIFLNNK